MHVMKFKRYSNQYAAAQAVFKLLTVQLFFVLPHRYLTDASYTSYTCFGDNAKSCRKRTLRWRSPAMPARLARASGLGLL